MKKKILLVLACIWIIISSIVIKSTYAKYITKLDSNTNIGISSWKINLNTQDIMSNSNFSNNLNLVFPSTTYHSQTVVPGATGYFELNVDCSNVSLPFKYTTTCSLASGNNITDLKITGFSLDNSSTITSYVNDVSTPIINYVQASATTSKIKVYVQWEDNVSGENLNDVQDTSIAINGGKAMVDVTVRFEQTQ